MWDEHLKAMPAATPYHDRWYNQLSASQVDGQALLFSYRRDSHHAVFPLIIFDRSGGGREATSAYGYPGPLANSAKSPPEFIEEFQHHLRESLWQEGVATAFSRLNPLSDKAHHLLENMGSFRHVGDTVMIGLDLPDEDRLRSFRRNHRKDIAKIRKLSLNSFVDRDFDHIDTFADLYRESMRRVQADERYLFDRAYFRFIAEHMPDQTTLLILEIDGVVISGGFFLHDQQTAYAHLVGCTDSELQKSPIKVLFDDACTLFRQKGLKGVFLGGGVGAHNDSLFHFKSGFSDIIMPFYVWDWSAA